MLRSNGTEAGGATIEELVQNAIGKSVTPTRLRKQTNVSFFWKLLFQKPVEGPFTSDLRKEEQPHYLFQSTYGFGMHDDSKGARYSTDGKTIASNTVAIITDNRSLFIYGRGDKRQTISIDHRDIDNLEFMDIMTHRTLVLSTPDRVLSFVMFRTDPYSSELSDAVSYISSLSDVEYEDQSYNFESGNFDAAREELIRQLKTITKIAKDLDIEYVGRCAVKGAKIGVHRGSYAAGIGFMLGAGYGIWSNLRSKGRTWENSYDDNSKEENPTETTIDDIDPAEVAKTMAKWQTAGQTLNHKGAELVGGALGAAIAIDQQTSGRQLTSLLADLDIEWISRQIESGDTHQERLQIASELLDKYSAELEELLNEGFFTQVRESTSTGA